MNRLIKKIETMLLAIVTIVCCSCTEDAIETTGDIYGKVTDSQTGRVLQGVTITLTPGGLSRTTGSDGTYEYLDLEAQQYQVQAQKTGYLTNTKSVNVLVGQSITCDIRLEPERQEADILISPSSLNFGTTQNEQALTITNNGNAATEWSLDLGNNNWLSATPSSGRINSGKTQNIIFTVDRDMLSEAKTAQISLSAFGNSYAIPVSCALKDSHSEMSVTPTVLDFGELLQEQTLTIKNTGNALLEWSISGLSEACLSLSETEGTVDAGGAQVVKVMLDRSMMTDNINTSLIVSDGIKQQPVQINAAKAVAKMSVTPLLLDFGDEATGQSFSIINTGSLDLTWTIVSPIESCLSVSEANGVIPPGGNRQINVSLDRSTMPETLNTVIKVSDGTREENVVVQAVKGSETAGLVVTQGLYTYYKFDDNFEDATENAVNGFGLNSPTFVEGVTPDSKAVKFSRSSNSSFNVPQPIIDSKNLTVSFWGKDFSDGNIFYMISSNENEPMFTLSMADGKLKFIVTRYNNWYQYAGTGTFAHPTITDGNWHHIAIVSDFSVTTYSTVTTTLYVDGMAVDTVTEYANAFSENGGDQSSYGTGIKFVMGGSLDLNYTNTLNGTNMSVDNFRVYDTRRLSANEIKEIYDARQ